MDKLKLIGPIDLLTASAICWRCHASTPVHAVVARSVQDPEDAQPADQVRSFVYDIDENDMPAALANQLRGLTQNYRPLFSRTLGETTWANSCIHCGALQGAFYLHSEPDGPFFGGPDECEPGSEQRLAEGDFEVADASYSLS